MRELQNARVSLREREAALSLLGAPGTQLVQLAAQGGEDYRASALLNPATRHAMILTTALKPLPGKDYQLWLYTADLHISGSKTASSDGQVADGLRVSGLKLSGAIPEFSPYVSVITADRVARLSNSSPPTTTVNLDEARQVVGTYQEANCQDAATAGGGGVAGSVPAAAPAK